MASVETIRAAAATTTSFVASTAFALEPSENRFALQFSITKGSATLIEYYFEASSDGGTTWFTVAGQTYSAGVTTLKITNVFTFTCSELGATDAIVVEHTRGSYPKYRLQVRSTGAVATFVGIVIRKLSGHS